MNTLKVTLTPRSALGICLILLSIGAGLVYISVQRDIERQLTNHKSQVLSDSNYLINSIQGQIHTTLSLMLASLVAVETNPKITQQEFAEVASSIMKRAPFILNLGLAKDNVISHIYPLSGNEAALGLNYMENPAQKNAVMRAIESKQAVLAGPINLLQGGQGLINRIPIFLDDENHRYWGLASIVIKVDEFFQHANFATFSKRLKFSLRGKDGRGADGEVFYGDPAMFENPQNLIFTIPIPNGNWQLSAAPVDGWVIDRDKVRSLYISGLTITLFLSGLIYLLLLTNIQLQQEKNIAVEATEHKTRFFTYMTHELRTPLTSIFGAIRMLEASAGNNAGGSETALIANAKRNCERLMCLINDILDLRKLELGQMDYKIQPVAVSEIVDLALDEMQQYARQYQINIALQQSIDPSLMVHADGGRLGQVLVNLLANAVRFSPTHSKVEIDVTSKNDSVCIAVTDHGKGIDKDKISTIFREFVQADHSGPSHKIPHGTGLGLAISKKLVEDQGGSLSCLNAPQGGAVFYILLPKIHSNNNNLSHKQRKAG